MTKTEPKRVLAWRLKLLQEASVMPGERGPGRPSFQLVSRFVEPLRP